jgi:type III pantothenate kinase
MLLAVDAGNTETVFGLYDGPELGDRWRIATEAQRTGDELGALLSRFLDLSALDGICLSSSVPRLTRAWRQGSRSTTTIRGSSGPTGSPTRWRRGSGSARP